ncbi:hypothetical protein E2C06_13045 [Dankookia rubra]|uniref:Uncharacterized protein n=1 Tax=Dankookia rubra TaxID=1442381 RepID=A0A4V3AA79_9PROT|nr:hypothetical protein [Dankookia rubra]TDH62105.1 hypothetical protein E2C06_13045 [Dankookia rubra]
MTKKFAVLAAAASVALLLGAHAGVAQPVLTPQGGGAYEMDHGLMGGTPVPRQHPGTAAPTLSAQGDGYEMDHSLMGGANLGSPSGGMIVGNSGDGGPEVRH